MAVEKVAGLTARGAWLIAVCHSNLGDTLISPCRPSGPCCLQGHRHGSLWKPKERGQQGLALRRIRGSDLAQPRCAPL